MVKIISNVTLVKLTNGKKIIERSKLQYEANIKHFAMRGFKLVSDQVKETKSNNENIVKLKPKKKKGKK